MVTADPATIAMFQVRLQALKMRRAGLSYAAISIVMDEYHGVTRRPSSWRSFCRGAGEPAKWHATNGAVKP